MMDFLYESRDRRDDVIYAPVQEWYRPPSKFRHNEWELVADLPKIKDDDGYPVRIYEMRMPARFYKVEMLDTVNSCGESKKGFAISTGSGDKCGRLAVEFALEAQRGMIGLDAGTEYVNSGEPCPTCGKPK
jgi:hypothetical protein